MASLSIGVTLANTFLPWINLSNSFSPFSKNLLTSSPVPISLLSVTKPKSLPIFKAVRGWSPVIIKTLIPAVKHF